jgi:acyl dehydratase
VQREASAEREHQLITITDVGALRDHIGQEIAVSDWVHVTQARIDQFAEASDDRQWIHVDAARAAAESPFKATIAHGFLTLSLTSVLLRSAMVFPGLRMAINYGCNRVRFVSPVPAGSEIRGRFTPLAVEELGGAIQVTWGVTIERAGNERPACTVEWLVRYYP